MQEAAHRKHGYQSLLVWQKGMAITKLVYQITSKLPPSEQHGLLSQMRRAAVSIPSNIAEGSKRASHKEKAHFYQIAHGSLAELETQTLLVRDLYPVIHIDELLAAECELGAMLYTFIRKQY